ncbi:DNA alkylation repair protein [Paraneptunicella aestuarii]|uniref:DNA alkylation repair protein n=1 Tax=Paraneptunicella aestuarii TaxID=2831148 RepID=UPI001E555D18|nr:DNA alkylation repair protein [Paraneptunicella aestuarii]UAA37684.1 DNA alkylation repair protein [Paraneptunicella aestuarii]
MKVQTEFDDLHPFVKLVKARLEQSADPGKAVQMQAYMKTSQPFYGVQAAERKKQISEIKKQHPLSSFDEYQTIILQLWQSPHREEMYQALEVAERFRQFRTPEAMPLYEYLIETANNWDTLDWIATKLVGDLVLKHPELESFLITWREHSSFWVRRAALLAQLKHKKDTNLQLLADSITALMHEKEFFIQKAIGWVLRELAKTNPDWVSMFVNQHEAQLSGLSKREALKYV